MYSSTLFDGLRRRKGGRNMDRLRRRTVFAPFFDLVEDGVKARWLTAVLISIVFLLAFSIIFSSILKDPVLLYGTNDVQDIHVLANPFSPKGYLDVPLQSVDPATGSPTTAVRLLGRATNAMGIGVKNKVIMVVVQLAVMDQSPLQQTGNGSIAYYMPGLHMTLGMGFNINPCSTANGVPAVDRIRMAQACSPRPTPSQVQTDEFGFFYVDQLVLSAGFPGSYQLFFSADGRSSEVFEIFFAGLTYDLSIRMDIGGELVPKIVVGEPFPYHVVACPVDQDKNVIAVPKSVFVFSYSPSTFVRTTNIINGMSSFLTPYWELYSAPDFTKILATGGQQQRLVLMDAGHSVLQTDSSGCVDLYRSFTVTAANYPLQFIGLLSDGVSRSITTTIGFEVLDPASPATVEIVLPPSNSTLAVVEGTPFGCSLVSAVIQPPRSGVVCMLYVSGYDGVRLGYLQNPFDPARVLPRQVQESMAVTDATGTARFCDAYLDGAGDSTEVFLRASCGLRLSSNYVSLAVEHPVSFAVFQFGSVGTSSPLPVCLRHLDSAYFFSVTFYNAAGTPIVNKVAIFAFFAVEPLPPDWHGPPGQAVAFMEATLGLGGLSVQFIVQAAVADIIYELKFTVDRGRSWLSSNQTFTFVDCQLHCERVPGCSLSALIQTSYFEQQLGLCSSNSSSTSPIPSYAAPAPDFWPVTPDQRVLWVDRPLPQNVFAVDVLDQCGNAMRDIPPSSYFWSVFGNGSIFILEDNDITYGTALFKGVLKYSSDGPTNYYVPVPLGNASEFPSAAITLGSGMDFVPLWSLFFPVDGFLCPLFRPLSPTVSGDPLFSFIAACRFRYDGPQQPLSDRIAVQSPVESVAVLSWALNASLYLIDVAVYPMMENVAVFYQVFQPPPYADFMCAVGFYARKTVDGDPNYPLNCLSEDVLFASSRSVTNASGVATMTFNCSSALPGTYLLAVYTATRVNDGGMWLTCANAAVDSIVITSPVLQDSIPLQNSSFLNSHLLSFNVSALSRDGRPLPADEAPLFVSVDWQSDFLVVSTDSYFHEAPLFVNSIVPCRDGTCSFIPVGGSAGPFNLTVFYAPFTPFQRTAVYSQELTQIFPMNVFLCNKTYVPANGEMVLSTTEGHPVALTFQICFQPSSSSSIGVEFPVSFEILNRDDSASVFPSLVFCSFGNVTAGHVYYCDAAIRLDSCPALRYTLQAHFGPMTTQWFYVDVYQTAVRATFLSGFDVPALPGGPVSIGTPMSLRVGVESSIGLPLPLQRVQLIPFYVAAPVQFLPNNASLSPASTKYDLGNLVDRGNSLVAPLTDVNVTQLALQSDLSAPLPDYFGVAQFSSFVMTAAKPGVYVLLVQVNGLPVSTSDPFEVTNPVSSASLSIDNTVWTLPGEEQVQLFVSTVATSYRMRYSIVLEFQRVTCLEFTGLCLVDPVVDSIGGVSPSGQQLYMTHKDGTFSANSIVLSGGSDGLYDVRVLVVGTPSNSVRVRLQNVADISTNALGSYRTWVVIACLLVVPGLIANRRSQSLWPILLGLINAAAMAVVLALFLYLHTIFVIDNRFMQTSYFGVALSYMAFVSICLIFVCFLTFAVVYGWNTKLSDSVLSFTRKREKRYEAYAIRLLSGQYRQLLRQGSAAADQSMELLTADLLEEETVRAVMNRRGRSTRRMGAAPTTPQQRPGRARATEGSGSSALLAPEIEMSLLEGDGSVGSSQEDQTAHSKSFERDMTQTREKALRLFRDERRMTILDKFMNFLERWHLKGFRYAWRRFTLSLCAPPSAHNYLETTQDFFFPQRLLLAMLLTGIFLLVAVFTAVVVFLWAEYLLTLYFSYFLEKYNEASIYEGYYASFRQSSMGQSVTKVPQENVAFQLLVGVFSAQPDVVQFFKNLHYYVEVSFALAVTLSGVYVATCLVLLMLDYRQRVFDARRGLWFCNRKRVGVVRAGQYPGLQVGGALLAFCIVTMVAWIVFFLLCWSPIRDWCISWLLTFLIAYFVSTLLFRLFLRFVVLPYVAGRDHIRRRHSYSIYDFCLTIFGVVSGILSTVVQFAVDLNRLVMLTVRLDIARGDPLSGSAYAHTGHASYCSMFFVDMTHSNNPLFVLFVRRHCFPCLRYDLPVSVQAPGRIWDGDPAIAPEPLTNKREAALVELFELQEFGEQLPSSLRDMVRNYHYESFKLSSQIPVGYSLVNPQSVQQRARNRWRLALTLHANPGMRDLRKKLLYERRKEQLLARFAAMIKCQKQQELLQMTDDRDRPAAPAASSVS